MAAMQHRFIRCLCQLTVIGLAVHWIYPVGLVAQRAPEAAARSHPEFVVPAWAFPSPVAALPTVFDSVTAIRVAASDRMFTDAQIHDLFNVADWYPKIHPAMPAVIARGRKPAVFACAYCHLPTGAGRPENAMLAGLPAAYIEQQVADLKRGVRRSAWREPYRPNTSMIAVAESATTAEVAEAARYFSRLRRVSRTRVVERTVIPHLESELGLFFADSGAGTEVLGKRLVMVPVDAERHERRDPTVNYIAYVPPGSLVRGRKIATSGVRAGAKSCISCHGPALRGVGVVPPIAGQSPSYILRQLFAFKAGARASPTGALMREVTASLELDDMIAVAAYAGSRKP